MKLSNLYRLDEGRKTIDTGEIGLNRKTWVLENPSAQGIIDAIDQLNKWYDGGDKKATAAGWTGIQGTWVWDRSRIDHFSVADHFGIDKQVSIPFYIKVEEIGPNSITTDVTFEVSDFSGRKSFSSLMRQPIILGIMRLLAKRKAQLPSTADDDDYAELLGSLRGSDY
jgi:hypothetical protein